MFIMKVIFFKDTTKMRGRVAMENINKPITDRNEVTKKAQELYLNVFEKYPTLDDYRVSTDLDKVLDFLNIVAVSIDFKEILDEHDDIAGLLSKEDDEWYIYTNSENPAYRQRFTIAHEIGHYYLNHISKETPNDVMWRDKVSTLGTNPMETSANAFAAELLMPESLIDEMYQLGYSVRKMAYELRVSIAAINNRLDYLGY